MRSLLTPLLLLACSAVRAESCSYFWHYQCIQVVDAQQRQIEQVLLLPDRLQHFPRDATGSCQQQAEARMTAVIEEIRSRYHQAARAHGQCTIPLGDLNLRIHEDQQLVERQWQRALRPSPQKTVERITDLPPL